MTKNEKATKRLQDHRDFVKREDKKKRDDLLLQRYWEKKQ